jgi:hydrogenase expression/formation protein HypC
MCLGIPGRVVDWMEDPPDLANVDVAGVVRPINMYLLLEDPPAPGDWIVIHSGFAMDRIDEAQAKRSLEFLEGYTEDPPGR